MKTQLPIIAAILLIGITCVVIFILNSKLQKRFCRNPLIQKLVSDMAVSMLERIDKIAFSDREPTKVITESATVFEDRIISQSASVFFRYEHMRLLRNVRERRLMARVIAKELKKNMRAEFEEKNSVKHVSYKLKSKCRRESNSNKASFSAYVSCFVTNEHYVCARSW